jgi:hypothetical protein
MIENCHVRRKIEVSEKKKRVFSSELVKQFQIETYEALPDGDPAFRLPDTAELLLEFLAV